MNKYGHFAAGLLGVLISLSLVCPAFAHPPCAQPVDAGMGTPYQTFRDIPEDWSGPQLRQMAELGLFEGVEAGKLAPEQQLTWGQMLAVLAKGFAEEERAAALAQGLPWDEAALTAVRACGLLKEGDFLPAAQESLNDPVTRQDGAVLMSRLLEQAGADGDSLPQPAQPVELAYSDWGEMDAEHQRAVKLLCQYRISFSAYVEEGQDGAFGWDRPMRRCDFAVLLMNTIYRLDALRAGEERTVTLYFLDWNTGEEVMPAQTIQTQIKGQPSYQAIAQDLVPFNLIPANYCLSYVSCASREYNLYCIPQDS